jgi:two-component system cell cycle sensor histidine kinase/response regulator CckA
LIAKEPNRFDGVVSDIVMPVMNGLQMARRFAEIRPDLPVLFMSGYPCDDRESFGADDIVVDFLQKPVSPRELTHAVSAMLERAKRGRHAIVV